MHLKFLGTGSRLNAALGNTSAYYTEDDKLLLIDCGETVFGEIQELHLLDGISKIFFICTHAHPDNVGGLGNLCLYCHQKNIEFYVVTDPSYILIYDLYDLLQISNCKGLWNSIDTSKLEKHFSEIQVVQYIRTEHCKDSYGANIPAYLVHFYTKDGPILYSGNTNRIDQIESWIKRYKNPVTFDRDGRPLIVFHSDDFSGIIHMYLEASEDDKAKNAHLCLSDLERIIPPKLRSRCTLMHFDSQKCIEHAKVLGFQIASS